ncbi:MAG: tRNA pseudouridine(55) synthase TruB [Halanaerobiales bacterium]
MSEMLGIINVLKPPSMTSFDVVNWIKKNLNIRKAGHTGTLDPLATGVLPVCINRATKIIPYLPEEEKEYIAEIHLGKSTNTLDAEGEIINEDEKWKNIKKSEFVHLLEQFKGEINQIPPMYSALKKNGKRLYELARKGKDIDREARKVKINQLQIINFDLPRIRLRVNCSRGTYIRSLARDIGNKLGTGAHLSFLVRTISGPFSINYSHSFNEIKNLDKEKNNSFIISADEVLNYPEVVVKNKFQKKAVNGAYLHLDELEIFPEQLLDNRRVLVYTENGRFISISEIEDDVCKPLRVFC